MDDFYFANRSYGSYPPAWVYVYSFLFRGDGPKISVASTGFHVGIHRYKCKNENYLLDDPHDPWDIESSILHSLAEEFLPTFWS